MARTQVGIVGAGPAGLVLSHLLAQAGIECVLLEKHARAHIEQRVRAGLIEHRTVEFLKERGLGERMLREGMVHRGTEFRVFGERHRIPYSDLYGGRCMLVYPQQELVADLVRLRLEQGGEIVFDAADVAELITSGRFDSVILHEMLHVIGITAFAFELKRLVAGLTTDESRFTGAGTRDSHWREVTFDSELMTGFIESAPRVNEFSIITIQALADIGYRVNTAAADPYTVPAGGSLLGSRLSTDRSSAWDRVLEPRFVMAGGRVVRTLPPPLPAAGNR